MITSSIRRRGLIAALGGLGGLALAMLSTAALAQKVPDFTGVTIKVATFGGGWSKVLDTYAGEDFRKTGGKVEFVASHPTDALAKLIAARGREAPFDVVEMSDSTFGDFTRANLIEKINLDMVPNKQYLDSKDFDSMKVASWVTQEGILYRPDKFKEAGVPAPKSYADLANPKLAGKVIMIDIGQSGAVQYLVGAALDGGGSEANIAPALDTLKKINPTRYWKLGAEALTALGTGDVWASTMHSGFYLQARLAGNDWAFVQPRAGTKVGLLKYGYLGVVKGSKNADAAAYFINNYIGESNQKAILLERGTVAVNKKVLAENKDDPKIKGVFILDDAGLANMVRVQFDKLDPEYRDKWTRATAQ
ncbi:ABC transporter substrate-binding protein [soil metagenome]